MMEAALPLHGGACRGVDRTPAAAAAVPPALAARAFGPSLAARAAHWAAWVAALAGLVWIAHDLGFTSQRLMAGAARAAHLVGLMWPPDPDGEADAIFLALGQTMAMAFLGTMIVVVAAVPLGILGARTIVGQPAVHFLVRRLFDLLRTIPSLVWAMILVAAFGLGPRVGVTAIVLAETPHLAKLFAETLENRREGTIESLQSAGASWLQLLRYGLFPEVLPLMAGKALLLFEANIRAAAALGLVGAGGIGVLLDTKIQLIQLGQVAWILILFMALVVAIDLASQALRRRLTSPKSFSFNPVRETEADA